MYDHIFVFVFQVCSSEPVLDAHHSRRISEVLEQSIRLAPYIALYDTPAFLTCALAPGAVYSRDLTFIQHIRKFREVDRPVADRVLESLTRHSC